MDLTQMSKFLSNNPEEFSKKNQNSFKRKKKMLEQDFISVQREYSMSSLVTANVRRISSRYWCSFPRRYLGSTESGKQGLFLFEEKTRQ